MAPRGVGPRSDAFHRWPPRPAATSCRPDPPFEPLKGQSDDPPPPDVSRCRPVRRRVLFPAVDRSPQHSVRLRVVFESEDQENSITAAPPLRPRRLQQWSGAMRISTWVFARDGCGPCAMWPLRSFAAAAPSRVTMERVAGAAGKAARTLRFGHSTSAYDSSCKKNLEKLRKLHQT